MKKLFRIEVAEDITPIDKDDNPISISDLNYTDEEYYMVEVWTDEFHYEYNETFETLEEAVKFMEEE